MDIQSLIITGSDQLKCFGVALDKIAALDNQIKEGSPDLLVISPQVSSIGIEDIRKLTHWSFLAPHSAKIKAAVVYEAQSLTEEAQNALLKLLEEPPADTFLILLTANVELLAETIVSRCQKIEVGFQKEEPVAQIPKLHFEILQSEPKERLSLLALNKDDAKEFIETQTLLWHRILKKSKGETFKKSLVALEILERSRQMNADNVAPYAAFEVAILSLPKIAEDEALAYLPRQGEK